MSRHKKPWTKGEDEILEELVLDGLNSQEIAHRVKRTRIAVMTRMGVLGLESEVPRGRPLAIRKGVVPRGKIVIRVTPTLHKEFAVKCVKNHVSMNETLRKLIREYLKA